MSASRDVLTVVLTKTGEGSYKYTALSHCWGSSKDAAKRKTMENAVSHETTGVPTSLLSGLDRPNGPLFGAGKKVLPRIAPLFLRDNARTTKCRQGLVF